MTHRILVTGARRGIGAALAVGLAQPERTLLLHHLAAPDEVARVAEQCRERGAEVLELDADLADPAAVQDLADRAGAVDILVNNAARASNVDIRELALEEWQQTFAVNVTAPMLLSRALAAGMAERGWGRIVNITSATVRLGGPSGPSYVSSKAALIGLTRSLARALGRDGITVNAISPGAIQTQGEVELAGGHEDPEAVARTIAVQAVPRRLVPDDLVSAVRFLVSDGAAATTGQVIEVGGGLVYR
ncbi:SDR family NAD(P)-dependent oxidoreductase [Phytohabitans suffuscus]|uniref:Beta-ketoacyl-ACP reductase n=1 Tax=Phytohabitans suffuscus TaxID=624315 RepID=A0A6F8YCW2_9ACTN|nr:SDR family NAD(P)-dependent oxidoreductase [Phytohabitans suffuscus]BCB83900.1 beta-ketoacyl-ACP reductase [Phytohabitans suffuscus]